MQINTIGGEFALIEKLAALIPTRAPDLLKGIGDDAAVIKLPHSSDEYLIVTADTLVDNEHFSFKWSRPEHIGIKAMECNISDIASMGGRPTFAIVSIVLPSKTDAGVVLDIYKGMAESLRKHGATVAGGDTTKGVCLTLSITLFGLVTKKALSLRSDARENDLIGVTGCLGASGAALSLLKKKYPVSDYLMKKHLTPMARLNTARVISPFARAMIDISDGLSSEVHHICSQSSVGAEISQEKIPLHTDVKNAAKTLNTSPYHFAFNGGEDLELLFTMKKEHFETLTQNGVPLYEIGKITHKKEGVRLLTPSNKSVPLKGGFDHFL